ncbi:acetyltransferase [Pseudomonas vanderleydeniana]|uniref:Acetyltransferase n=1 Tax=Pseudomonas vanderleydeniana TaxID=2745495 RepID=A0A9E6PPC3_9PSED|nr:acetyltransferase [Pseudomonas vanderleydeniana]QXI30229.1 acetyltransferase [Pseudomonas vanderleydeniana]
MKKLAVLGASGHGKVVADTAECCGWTQVDFYDDGWPEITVTGAWEVIGDGEALLASVEKYDGVLVAIGNNSIRQKKIIELELAGAELISLKHPQCSFSRYATLGKGSVVFAGAIVNVGASIGVGAIINSGCSVDHDCQLGEYVHISPGARLAGGVVVGDLTWVGVGAAVRQSLHIGSNVIVGAGAAVISDIPDNLTFVGVPARKLK